MKNKNWKVFGSGECPRCGSDAEVYTSALDEFFYDGDNAECFSCGLIGCVSADENEDGEGVATIIWNDFED